MGDCGNIVPEMKGRQGRGRAGRSHGTSLFARRLLPLVGAALAVPVAFWAGPSFSLADVLHPENTSTSSQKETFRRENKSTTIAIESSSRLGKADGPALKEEISALRKEEMKLGQALLREFPGSIEPLVLMGNIYRQYGNSAEAIAYWQKALQLDAKRADVYDSMAMIAMEKAQYEEAIARWRKALAINPHLTDIHSSIAQALMRLGRYDEAAKELEQEIEVFPNSRAAHFLLGQVSLKLRRYDQAEKCYQEVIAIDPNYTSAYYGLFTACTRLGQKDKAQEYVATFKKLKAKDMKGLRSRNETLDDLAATRKAAADTYMRVEQVYRARRKPERSEELLKRAAALDPENAVCLLKLASLYEMGDRIQDALEIHKKIGELEPENPMCQVSVGILSARLKKFADAEQAFGKVVKLAPQSSTGYRLLAQLYLEHGTKLGEARTLAEKAVALEQIAANYFVLGWACDGNGDTADAFSAIKRAVELDPKNLRYRRMYEFIRKKKLKQ